MGCRDDVTFTVQAELVTCDLVHSTMFLFNLGQARFTKHKKIILFNIQKKRNLAFFFEERKLIEPFY